MHETVTVVRVLGVRTSLRAQVAAEAGRDAKKSMGVFRTMRRTRYAKHPPKWPSAARRRFLPVAFLQHPARNCASGTALRCAAK